MNSIIMNVQNDYKDYLIASGKNDCKNSITKIIIQWAN